VRSPEKACEESETVAKLVLSGLTSTVAVAVRPDEPDAMSIIAIGPKAAHSNEVVLVVTDTEVEASRSNGSTKILLMFPL